MCRLHIQKTAPSPITQKEQQNIYGKIIKEEQHIKTCCGVACMWHCDYNTQISVSFLCARASLPSHAMHEYFDAQFV